MQRDYCPGPWNKLVDEWAAYLYERLRPPERKEPAPIIPLYPDEVEVYVFNDETKELERYK